jgi:hypothetical protein
MEGVSSCKNSSIFSYLIISVEVCISFQLFMINYCRTKYVKENTLLNCNVNFY